MDLIVNTIKDGITGNGRVGGCLGVDSKAFIQVDTLKKMSSNVKDNLNKGSQACPVVGECRDISQGIA